MKPTLGANMGNIVVLFKLIRVWRIVTMRNTPKCDDVSMPSPEPVKREHVIRIKIRHWCP